MADENFKKQPIKVVGKSDHIVETANNHWLHLQMVSKMIIFYTEVWGPAKKQNQLLSKKMCD